MAEWLKALVSKTGIPLTGYRGFESPFFRRAWEAAGRKSDRLFSVSGPSKTCFRKGPGPETARRPSGPPAAPHALQGPPRREGGDVADRREGKSPPGEGPGIARPTGAESPPVESGQGIARAQRVESPAASGSGSETQQKLHDPFKVLINQGHLLAGFQETLAILPIILFQAGDSTVRVVQPGLND